jgi:hypothetical protein
VELEYEDVPPTPPSVDDAAAPPPPERPPVWTRATVPSSWKKVPPPRPRASGDASTVDISTPPDLSLSLSESTHGWTDPPPRTSDVELECDVLIEDVLNVEDVVRRPLHAADDTVRLVQSLVPVWEEETRRAIAEGSTPPARGVASVARKLAVAAVGGRAGVGAGADAARSPLRVVLARERCRRAAE